MRHYGLGSATLSSITTDTEQRWKFSLRLEVRPSGGSGPGDWQAGAHGNRFEMKSKLPDELFYSRPQEKKGTQNCAVQ